MSSSYWYSINPSTLYHVTCFITVRLLSSLQSESVTLSILVLPHQDLPFSSFTTRNVMIALAFSYVKEIQLLLSMSRLNNIQSPHNPYLICQRIGGGSSIKIEDGLTSVESPWHLERTLTVKRSNHPLDIACKAEVLNWIYQSCIQEETIVVARLPWHPLLLVTSKDLRRLLSYSSPTSDSIMIFYLEKLTQHYGITYLTTSFLYTL